MPISSLDDAGKASPLLPPFWRLLLWEEVRKFKTLYQKMADIIMSRNRLRNPLLRSFARSAPGRASTILRERRRLARAFWRISSDLEATIPPHSQARRPTIHDVAQHASVSSTTVSHVLNQTRFVADETRARVLSAMSELGYHPDAAARSLRSRRRRIVGLLVTNLQNRGFVAFMDGIDEEFIPAGFSLIVSATRGNPERELACLRTFREQGVDGLIIAGSAGAKEDYLHRLYENGLPMVQINRIGATFPVDHVLLDYAEAGRAMAEHLVGLGHRRFALLGPPVAGRSMHPFVEGWNQALGAAGIAPESTSYRAGVSREEVGYRLAREVLVVGERPSAVVTANTPILTGALLACQELGIAIPGDLSVATLGDASWTQVLSPPITSIPDASPEFGRLAARFLLDRILGTYTGPPRRKTFPAELIVRRSTAGSSRDVRPVA